MKNVLTKFLLAGSLGLLMLASCKKNDAVVTSNGGKAGTLSASSTTVILSKANDTVSDVALSFNFTAANYGFKAASTNTIEIDRAADNWANPISITLAVGVKSYSYTTAQLNTLVLGLKIGPDTAGQIVVRVVNTVSASVAPVYSNVLTVTVTPYSTVLPASYVYIAGAYESWIVPSVNVDSLQATNNSGIYKGVIAFTQGNLDFKILLNNLNYNGNYGLNALIKSSAATDSLTVVAGSQVNIPALSLATVDPAVNINTNYVVFDKNKSTVTVTPDQWGVVGSATAGSWPAGSGFQDDVDMKYNNKTQTWSVVVALSGGNQIKFRRNHDWGINYGSVTSDGVLDTDNNNNINITATGNYLVTLDIVHLTYSLVKQ